MSITWTIAESAYAAGLLDGEGHITIRRARNRHGRLYHNVQVSVSNTDEAMILWLQGRFTGHVGIKHYEDGHRKTLFRVTFHGPHAEALLATVLPYLITKRAQAELALQLRQTIGPKYEALPEGTQGVRETLHAQMRVLNRRGA